MINAPLQAIGRDPVITMQICKMIGERAAKTQRNAAIVAWVKQLIIFWR